MCGIVGYIGPRSAREVLLTGLEKLEYRGYDSAGLATLHNHTLECVRSKGKLENLRRKLAPESEPARVGIGHTRWATHGKPEEHNAHPHLDAPERLAVVQNGIIENYLELRRQLQERGCQFRSDTDTEVIPHLVSSYLEQTRDHPHPLLEAVRLVVNQLQGAFALAILCADYPEELVVVRQHAPLCIGFGPGEVFCASDTPALVPYTRQVLTLENGELARLTPNGVELYTFAGEPLTRSPHHLNWNPVLVEKQGFRHFMIKEIYEQPGVVRSCLQAYAPDLGPGPIHLGLPDDWYQDLEQVQILGCGTSWHASLVGKYLLEQLAGVPTLVHYASEFRYAPPPLSPNTLTVGVTQSGETADTLGALDLERQRRSNCAPAYRARLLGVTNRPESTLGHLVPQLIDTLGGIEIGVAATKTFIGQLMAFYLLALDLGQRRGTLAPERLATILHGLQQLPAAIELILEGQEHYIATLAHRFADTQDFIFLGRGINYPIALEGALKLKEISYIHAEGYPAGEMKHGPIALLDAKVPVVAIANPGMVYEKVLSNALEAKARDAQLIGVTPLGSQGIGEVFDHILPIPPVEEVISPLVTVIPLQLLAYHIAALRGLDVDQPRNLAKSVTVE